MNLNSFFQTHTQVKRIINEPTAAALAFGVIDTNTGGGSRNLLVFDFGGGTLDVTIMQVLHALKFFFYLNTSSSPLSFLS